MRETSLGSSHKYPITRRKDYNGNVFRTAGYSWQDGV